LTDGFSFEANRFNMSIQTLTLITHTFSCQIFPQNYRQRVHISQQLQEAYTAKFSITVNTKRHSGTPKDLTTEKA